MALRGWLHGRTLMQAPMWVVLGANVWHALLNWVLIYGNLGAPELGAVGAALSTALSRALNFAALVGLVRWLELYRGAWGPFRLAALGGDLRSVLALGIPFGLQIALEVWAFSGATLIAGRLGVEAIASHQIVLNMASLTFMVPLGLSLGAATRVGNLVGAREPRGVRSAARAAVLLAAAVMATFGAAFVLLREQLPALYTTDAGLLARCALILPIAAAFQVFDGVQVVAAGILRGMGRTQAPALANAVGYYAIGLPLGWWLAFERELGLPGIWWGLACGLGVVASSLLFWIRRSEREV
jgi:MATE family multidrug resistance protein